MPTAVEPRITLGEIALDRGQTADAVTAFDAVLRRWPDHVDALYLHAVAVARAGDPARAIQDLNRGLRSSSVGGRDTILYRVMELAGELRERVPGAQPLCLLAHLHRYLRVFDERQGAIAMDYARQAIGAGDRPADAYLTLGIVHDKRGEYESARRYFRDVLTEYSDSPLYGDALIGFGWAMAEDLAARLRESDPPIVARIEEGRVLLDLRSIALLDLIAGHVKVGMLSWSSVAASGSTGSMHKLPAGSGISRPLKL